jgi:hypothetical protein
VRVAWFAPTPDDVALELGAVEQIDYFSESTAHDFVWQHFRSPYDVTVFELGDTPAHAYVWPYVFHYPGVVILHATSLQHSRSETLTKAHRHRDLRRERGFSGWDFLRAPLTASRLVVVPDATRARDLAQDHPGLPVRIVPAAATPRPVTNGDGQLRFHVAGVRRDVVGRATARARDSGIEIAIAATSDPVSDGDVVIALEWPPTGGPPLEAIRALAAGLPVIVLETEAVAGWPTLDPQTWQRRGFAVRDAPIVVSIDPRDEEHSLMLALRRLASDAALRTGLGAAARAWTREHASIPAAVAAWREVLSDAASRKPFVAGAQLPSHLTADGTERARTILSEMGVSVDFLE